MRYDDHTTTRGSTLANRHDEYGGATGAQFKTKRKKVLGVKAVEHGFENQTTSPQN